MTYIITTLHIDLHQIRLFLGLSSRVSSPSSASEGSAVPATVSVIRNQQVIGSSPFAGSNTINNLDTPVCGLPLL